ncbi:MAG TPA: porin family protein [Cyclobacteriaceae bacterium]|nr:porin family protein [Cyclobacteriaceae bacterium]
MIKTFFKLSVFTKALFFILAVALSSTVSAQILIGPTAGPNFSWITFDDKDLKDVYDVSPITGFHAGVALSFRVQKRFFLHSSLIYSTKGKILKADKDPLFRNEVRYKYIELPILYTIEFKGSLGGNKQYKWYFGAGPNVSYWIGGRGKISSSDLTEVGIGELNYRVVYWKDQYEVGEGEMSVEHPNRVQLGLTIGTGFVFEPMGAQKFMVMFRYELGHSFLSRTSDGVFQPTLYTDEMRIRNQGFRISLSYLVDLKTEQRKKGKSTIKESNKKRRRR